MPGFLFDSNLWVALTFASHPFHDRVGEQLRQSLPDRRVCRVRATELSALRLITTPTIHRAFGVPYFSNKDAITYLTSLFEKTGCVNIKEPEGTRRLWLRLSNTESDSPKVWMDAYLAAVAIQGGLDFVTIDSDFQDFRSDGLSVVFIE